MNFGNYTNLTDLFNAIQDSLGKRQKSKSFTKAQWNALTTAQKAQYDGWIINLTDDYDALVELDDTKTTTTNVWSASKVNTELSDKVGENPTFTQASTRANIASGESFATILGKIKKWFADLKSGAFKEIVTTSAVSALAGATSVTITNSAIHTTSLIQPFADNGTNTPLAPPTMTITEGQCVLGFDALEADTSFQLLIHN